MPTERDYSAGKNPPELDGVEDLSALTYLEMPNVLYNLEYRFLKLPKKMINTCVSTILLIVNPYEWLDWISNQGVIDMYFEAQKTGDLIKTPHPYAVASRSYVRMVSRNAPQSLLCCGISGAGKSECAKQLIRYLARTSPSAMAGDKAQIENQIIQASIVLEAWGNAKTTLNNNSSRFGKFTKLMYKDGAILGSWMETYLLEKSRVIMQGPQERNYHIFYFMFKGLDAGTLEKFGLGKPEDFWYLKQGGCTEVDGIDDKACYEELMESLTLFRFGTADLQAIWSLTAGILQCGNTSYAEDDSGKSIINPSAKGNLNNAAELWGIKPDALENRLITASMEVMKKTIIKDVPPSKFNDNRDAITKALFENCFLFVVERINAELFHVDDDVRKIMFIGILDIFGFENFVINSIEQFCINFTNEKIQGYFNYNIIASEQEEYIKESVLWKPMDVPNNDAFIAMVEAKKVGMFALLDSACKAPKPAPENFVKEFFKKQGKMKQYLEKAKGPNMGGGKKKKKGAKGKKGKVWVGFKIHHFCDDVIYTALLFLDKNMDAIHPDSAKMFKKSKYTMLQMVGGGTHHKKKKKKKKAKSVCKFFSSQLINLMKTLKRTEPYFCRAMKPNWHKSAKEWDDVLVEDQLRSGGLIEALRVLKLGYPTRVPYQKLWDKFHGKIKNPMVNNLNQMGFAEVVLSIFDVSESDYELGLTKIFFKPAKAAVLETILASAGKPLTDKQNEMIKHFVQRKRLKQLIGACKIFLKLSLRIRFKRAKENLEKWARVTGTISISLVRHAKYARDKVLIKAAQTIQSYFRGKYFRSHLEPEVKEMKQSSEKIFHMWRRYEERTKLLEWLLQNCEGARKRAEELSHLSPEERKKHDEERLAARKAAALAAANAAADERAADDAAAAAKAKALEEAKAQAMASQKENEVDIEDADKAARLAEAARAKKERLAAEKAKRDKENAELWKLLHPGDSDEEGMDDDDEDGEGERHVTNFYNESAHGHLFSIFKPRRNRPPHDRFIKIDYDMEKKPLNISWGTGDNRRIDFDNIRFVLKGCKTATMNVWKDDTDHVHDDDHVYSIVTKTGETLDLCSSDDYSRDLWVEGITKLLGMTEEDRASMQASYTPGEVSDDSDVKRDKTASQLETQKLLFLTMARTLIRELNYEGTYGFLGESIIEQFVDDAFYNKALAQQIAWRNWEKWIRKNIVEFLVAAEVVGQDVADSHEKEVAAAATGESAPEPNPKSDDCLLQ